jgi:urease accessory protein
MAVKSSLVLVPLFALTLSSLAYAHPGHDALGLSGGILHPLTGLDHLLAMLAIGLWASQQKNRLAQLLIPITFVAAMLLGGAATFAGLHLPAFLDGPGTIASVLVLGLLVASAARLPLALGMSLTAAFAICHGYAHAQHLVDLGAAGALAGSPAAYALGFLLTTASLHLVGFLAGMLAARTAAPALVRFAGALTAAVSLVCFLQM